MSQIKSGQYSGIISQFKLEQLTQQIIKNIRSWSDEWFSDAVVCVDINFENKTLFSTKKLVNKEDCFWHNPLACCQFNDCSNDQLVKFALGLAPTSQLNNIDQQLVDFIANGMSLTLNTCVMEILTSKNNELLQEKLNETSQEKNKDKNICLSFNVVINNFKLTLSFTDEFLFSYQNLNTARVKNKLKVIKMSEILAHKTMTFNVALPLPRISFAQLLQLKKGQVIKLEQSLAQPLAIKHGNNAVPFKGFLIKKGVQKAIYLSGK